MDFFEVYEQHYDRVRNFILASVKNRWVADDLVQETFIRVMQNLAKVRDPAKVKARGVTPPASAATAWAG